MIKKFRRNKTVWFDLIKPSMLELEDVFREINLSYPKDFKQRNPLPFVDEREKYLKTICLLPNINQSPNINICHLENEIIIGTNFIITIHSEPINSFEELENIFDNKINISKKNQEIIIFSKIILNVYKNLIEAITNINNQLKEVGRTLFDTKDSVYKLIKIKKNIKEIENNNFHQTIWLKSLRTVKNQKLSNEIRSLEKELEIAKNKIEQNKVILNSLLISRIFLDIYKTRKKIIIFILITISLLITILLSTGLYLS